MVSNMAGLLDRVNVRLNGVEKKRRRLLSDECHFGICAVHDREDVPGGVATSGVSISDPDYADRISVHLEPIVGRVFQIDGAGS